MELEALGEPEENWEAGPSVVLLPGCGTDSLREVDRPRTFITLLKAPHFKSVFKDLFTKETKEVNMYKWGETNQGMSCRLEDKHTAEGNEVTAGWRCEVRGTV